MKLLRLLVLCTAFPVALPAQAATLISALGAPQQPPAHSGGCRKSSPPGQCCHAGSEPLHCH